MGASTVSDTKNRTVVRKIYKKLFSAFGPQQWWPAKTPFEVMVGAMLVQNTSWSNTARAIAQLKKEKCLSPFKLQALKAQTLASLIRPAGYFRIKAKRLNNFVAFFMTRYQGRIDLMKRQDAQTLRCELLDVNGIGEETADSMLLYALDKPFFVIDNYTNRVFTRHKIFAEKISYQDAQQFFHKYLPQDVRLYNEYHALIVRLAKEFCRTKPLCQGCPLQCLF